LNETDDILRNSKRVLETYKNNKKRKEGERLLEVLPQGEGSGLDADMVDGEHADEIKLDVLKRLQQKLRVGGGGGGGSGGGVTDHGLLTGLLDDDHTQYLPVDGSRPVTHHIDISEVVPPANPAADTLRLYVEDVHGFPFYSFRDATGMVRKIVRDSVFVAKNESGSNIAANQAVYATGAAVDVPTVDLAKADAAATMPSIGVTVEAIADGAHGRVMQVGLLENVNTNAFNAGDVLYVSATVAGAPTSTPPTYPNIRQEMGTVLVKDAVVGAVQLIARSMFNEGILDHGGLLGLADDDHAQYLNVARHAAVTHTVKTTLSFAVVGDCSVDTDVAPTIVAPCTLTITKVKVVVKTAPTGSALTVDVNKAGVTIFTDQGKRPSIAAGATQDDSDTPDVTALAEGDKDVTALAEGDKVTVDIDQIGSGVAGADLTVEVVCNQTVVFS